MQKDLRHLVSVSVNITWTKLHSTIIQCWPTSHHRSVICYYLDIGQLKSIMIIFYGGLSCFHSSRKRSKKHTKLAKQAINVMREKGGESSWNYLNKIHLLEAEIFSATGKKDHAKVSFNAAISAARSSKFIHEQGLACELAALHCLKHGDNEDGSNLLEQALECYTKWGSQVKIDSITKQLEKIAAKAG